MMLFRTIRLDYIKDNTFNKLFKLTLPEGLMHPTVEWARKNSPEKSGVVYCKSNGDFIGWASVCYNYVDDPRVEANIMLFVAPEFRRQGVGSELLKRAHKYSKETNAEKEKFFKVHPHDCVSRNFFVKHFGNNCWYRMGYHEEI